MIHSVPLMEPISGDGRRRGCHQQCLDVVQAIYWVRELRSEGQGHLRQIKSNRNSSSRTVGIINQIKIK